MQDMTNNCAEIKADPKVKGLSNIAKLLLAYMEITGTTCAKTIAAKLDIPIRTIQRLKLDCATAMDGGATSATCAIDGAEENATSATDGVFDAPLAPSMAFSPSRVLDNTSLPSLEETGLNNNNPPVGPPKPKTAKRGSRLPDEWELPEDWRQWTLTNCPVSTPPSVATEALKFANYWQAKSGKDAAKVSWFKTWQNWCLTAFGTAPARPRPQAFSHAAGSTLTAFLAKRNASPEAVQ